MSSSNVIFERRLPVKMSASQFFMSPNWETLWGLRCYLQGSFVKIPLGSHSLSPERDLSPWKEISIR